MWGLDLTGSPRRGLVACVIALPHKWPRSPFSPQLRSHLAVS